MTLVLPYPPSANRYWRNWRGRMVKSPEAKAYQNKAGWIAKQAGMKPVTGPVTLRVALYRPLKSGDLDNYLKVMIDALKGIAYDDDKQIIAIDAHRYDDKDNPRAEITIREAFEF